MNWLGVAVMSPLLAVQALWVILRAQRLPEAAGPRQGTTGTGPPLRVLILGDSSAAGVGVDHQDDALAGQLAQALARDFQVTWQVVAKTGATATSTCQRLVDQPPLPFDIAVVALGVNDTKNGVRSAMWQAQYQLLIALLRGQSKAATLYLSGVPPLGDFPLLPRPLRHVLGARAAHFDGLLRQIAKAHNATHIGFDLPLEPDKMASDGFHPGPQVYTHWAQMIAQQIRDQRGNNTGAAR